MPEWIILKDYKWFSELATWKVINVRHLEKQCNILLVLLFELLIDPWRPIIVSFLLFLTYSSIKSHTSFD